MFLLICMLLGATYGFSQKAMYNVPETKRMRGVDADLHMHYGAEGVIRVKGDEPCDVWVDVPENGKIVRYYPMNLTSSMKVDGNKISFDYGVPENTSERSCLGKGIYLQNAKVLEPKSERM